MNLNTAYSRLYFTTISMQNLKVFTRTCVNNIEYFRIVIFIINTFFAAFSGDF